jgi:hypothetical protein
VDSLEFRLGGWAVFAYVFALVVGADIVQETSLDLTLNVVAVDTFSNNPGDVRVSRAESFSLKGDDVLHPVASCRGVATVNSLRFGLSEFL